MSKEFNRADVLAVSGVIALAALVERAMGRLWICACGRLKLWHGAVDSENSQHLSDWYSFSHIIHGFLFYGLIHWITPRRWTFGSRLLLAIGIEACWEITENTSFMIERYRQGTVSLNYYGDSIANSVSDMLFCAVGFILARYLPVWATILLIVAMELGVGYAIRDNFTLNVIMLLHPFQIIRKWQMGA
jgi:Protein of unknown function (DUF2585)